MCEASPSNPCFPCTQSARSGSTSCATRSRYLRRPSSSSKVRHWPLAPRLKKSAFCCQIAFVTSGTTRSARDRMLSNVAASTSAGHRSSGTEIPSRSASEAHLPFEIGLQVVVVEQDDVGVVAHRPERREVMQHGGEAGRSGLGRRRAPRRPTARSARSPSRDGRRSLGQELGDVVEADRSGAGSEERHHVGVREVVVPRERDVARVATDADVCDAADRTAGRRTACGS